MREYDIILCSYKLRDKIINSDLYMDLKNRENKMLSNLESVRLLNEYEKAKENYYEAQRFVSYGSDIKKRQKELSEIKAKVYENEYISGYNKAYQSMNKELKKIERLVFKDIVKERKEILLEE